jgi:hypothetical protein
MSKIGKGVSVEVLHIYEVEKLYSIQPFFKPLAELSNGGNTLNKSSIIRIPTAQNQHSGPLPSAGAFLQTTATRTLLADSCRAYSRGKYPF